MSKTKTKKKKKELNPIIQNKTKDFDKKSIQFIAENLDKASITLQEDEKPSFSELVVKGLNDKTNITMKTEYISIPENFAGTKLEFLAKYGNMPYLDGFLDMFEIRRVSLNRKGRQEDIMLVEGVKKQEDEEKFKNLGKQMFGVQPT